MNRHAEDNDYDGDANDDSLEDAAVFFDTHAVILQSEQAAERAAFLSLAKTQRRISWTYRKWALEAEAAGKLDDYRRYAKTARDLWRDALEHIALARMRTAK